MSRPTISKSPTIAECFSSQYHVSLSKINSMVKEALVADSSEDLVGVRSLYDQLNNAKIDLVNLPENATQEQKDEDVQRRANAHKQLTDLFKAIFEKTREYFSAKRIDVSKFEEAGEVFEYIETMLGSDVGGILSNTYQELSALAGSIVDFVSTIASRASQDDIDDARKNEIMQSYIANLPIVKLRDLGCIAGSAERFSTLANELKPNLALAHHVGTKAIVTGGGLKNKVYDGNQIHLPLFLEVLLGIRSDQEADNLDRFVLGLKTEINSQLAWQAINDYYQKFSETFLSDITGKLKDFNLKDGRNIFDISIQDVLENKGGVYSKVVEKLNQVLRRLGIDENGITPFIKEDENDDQVWKTPQEIAATIAEELAKKYPAITKSELEKSELEDVINQMQQLSKAKAADIIRLLKSDDLDQKLIGFRAIYIAAQTFHGQNNHELVIDVLTDVLYSMMEEKPKTIEEFVAKAEDEIKKLLELFPGHYFNAKHLTSFIASFAATPDRILNNKMGLNLLMLAYLDDNNDLSQNIIGTSIPNPIVNSGHKDTLLHVVCRAGNDKIVEKVLENIKNKGEVGLLERQLGIYNGKKESPFSLAVTSNNFGLMGRIFSIIDDENAKLQLFRETLEFPVRGVLAADIPNPPDPQMRRLLVKKTPLQIAFIKNDSGLMELILSNIKDEASKTALIRETMAFPNILSYVSDDMMIKILGKFPDDQFKSLMDKGVVLEHLKGSVVFIDLKTVFIDLKSTLHFIADRRSPDLMKYVLGRLNPKEKLDLLKCEKARKMKAIAKEEMFQSLGEENLLVKQLQKSPIPLPSVAHCAVQIGRNDMLKAIMESCNNEEERLALIEAAPKKSPKPSQKHLLSYAFDRGNVEAVKIILSYVNDDEKKIELLEQTNLFTTKRTPVENALVKGKREVVKELLHHYCQEGNLVIMRSIWKQLPDQQKVEFLFESSRDRKVLLHNIIYSELDFIVDIMEILTKTSVANREAICNRQDRNGNTALHILAKQGRFETMYLFCQNGADIALKNDGNDIASSSAQNLPLEGKTAVGVALDFIYKIESKAEKSKALNGLLSSVRVGKNVNNKILQELESAIENFSENGDKAKIFECLDQQKAILMPNTSITKSKVLTFSDDRRYKSIDA